MPQTNIFIDEKEDLIIIKFSKEWKLSKVETIKKIIRGFEELHGCS